jgi:hypothetical protein
MELITDPRKKIRSQKFEPLPEESYDYRSNQSSEKELPELRIFESLTIKESDST